MVHLRSLKKRPLNSVFHKIISKDQAHLNSQQLVDLDKDSVLNLLDLEALGQLSPKLNLLGLEVLVLQMHLEALVANKLLASLVMAMKVLTLALNRMQALE